MPLPICPKGGFVTSNQFLTLLFLLTIWPKIIGKTTVTVRDLTTVIKGTGPDSESEPEPTELLPMKISNKAGDKNMPKKLPKAELKIAAASFPPIAFVKITAEDTGGGIHDKTTKVRCHIFVENSQP